MSSATSDTTAVAVGLVLHGPTLAVPSLDELERLAAVPERRVVIKGVDWTFYERLVDSIPEGVRIRVNYDGKDLELMSLSPFHDGVKKQLARVVELVAEELEIPFRGLGQTTWKRPDVERGLEADECSYFASDKLSVVASALKRGARDVALYPNPDLGIEVDLSPSKIDRPGIYANLGVAEIWRFDGEQIVIERLDPSGSYQTAPASGFLWIKPDEIRRWVIEEDALDGLRWARGLRAWVQTELAPRRDS